MRTGRAVLPALLSAAVPPLAASASAQAIVNTSGAPLEATSTPAGSRTAARVVPQPPGGHPPTSAPSPLWTGLLSAAAALAGALVGFWSTRASSRAAIIQKTNELEIESLDRRLSQFVGPFMQLSEENRMLAAELKRRQALPSDFRTLTGLLTTGWREGLSRGEANLLQAVVGNGVELRRLLMESGSAMVSPQLIPFFSRASTHFRILELAYAGALDPDPARYSAYVYPRELDGIMEAERLRLERRRELLRSQPYRSHPRSPALELPTEAPAPPP